MGRYFGRTWWSDQWLNALQQVDYSNRLPRGRAYARQGAVVKIDITRNIIKAKVTGTRSTPYSVDITVPEFTEKEKTVLVEEIINNTVLLSSLLNRELPPEVLTLATSKKIKIFPESWKDLKMSCSCPDWAVPCKHIAAVIYVIANHIDQNPFLVFEMHNLDIFSELKKFDVHISNLRNESIQSLSDICEQSSNAKQNNLKNIFPDISILQNLNIKFIELFPKNTLFYSENFYKILKNIYEDVTKSDFVSKHPTEEYSQNLAYGDFQIIFSSDKKDPDIIVNFDSETKELKIKDLIRLFYHTDIKYLEKYSESYVFLFRLFNFCKIIIQKECYLPDIIKWNTDSFKILWKPATIEENVKNILQQISAIIPENITKIKIIEKNSGQRFNFFPVNNHQATQLICSAIIEHFIYLAFKNYRIYPEKDSDLKVLNLFFNNELEDFKNFEESEIPNSIKLWLSKFYVTDRKIVPVLLVEDINDYFIIDVLVKDTSNFLNQNIPLKDFLKTSDYENRMYILKYLHLFKEHFSDLELIIKTKGEKQLIYKSEQFLEILTKILPILKVFGLQVLLPKGLEKILKPNLSLKPSLKNLRSFLTLDDLVEFDWQICIGNEFISKDEFISLSRKTMGLIKFRENYFFAEKKDIEKILFGLNSKANLSKTKLIQALFTSEYENTNIQIDPELKNEIEQLLKVNEIELPENLNANLRNYQKRGYNWLYRNFRIGLGCILADDMGLGKTLQAITLILKFKQEGHLKNTPALVIVPTTLITNWINEIQKFAPVLEYHIYHGNNRNLKKDIDIIITTYGIARSDINILEKVKFQTIIIDEAQNIKNPKTQQSQCIKKLKAKFKIALSGTPVENRLSEYWNIFDFIIPGYLGSLKKFTEEFAKPIELYLDHNKAEKFKLLTSPFILRRVKTDKSIITDLPEKFEINRYCNLTPEQAALYKNVTNDIYELIASSEGFKRDGLVLKLLTCLKQICNHPANYLKSDNYSPELSGKAMMLLQILENIYDINEKVLIFTQYKEMSDILCKIIENNFDKKVLQIHGGLNRKKRDEVLNNFHNKKIYDTLILTLKAGGTGLNLITANNVIHYDLWWNPAVETQASDRVYRIGQNKNVMIYRLISKATIEEKIDNIIKSKQNLADITVFKGEKWIGELSNEELKNLIF